MSNNSNGAMEVDVERMMEVIQRRAERKGQSLPTAAMVTMSEQPAPETLERQVSEALKAQATLNASIVESLARLDDACEETLRQGTTNNEETRAAFAGEVASMRDDLHQLEQVTKQLKRSTLGLLYLVQTTRQQMVRMTEAFGEASQLSARVLALEEAVRVVTARQDKVRTE